MKFKLMYLLTFIFISITELHAETLDFSQYKGKNYKAVKAELLAKGWKLVDNDDEDVSINEQYPEVTCGSGSMAICSVGFKSKQGWAAFIVKKSGSELIIAGEY